MEAASSSSRQRLSKHPSTAEGEEKRNPPVVFLMSCDWREVTELLRETRECLECASESMAALWLKDAMGW